MNGETYTAREIIYGGALIGWRHNIVNNQEEVEYQIINQILNQLFN